MRIPRHGEEWVDQEVMREGAIPALVEGVDLDAVVGVLLQNLLGVLVRVEGVHEHQRHVCVKGLI